MHPALAPPARRPRSPAWLAACALACAALAGCAQAPTVVYEGRSQYTDIIVTEDAAGLRTLLFERGGGRQSVVDPADPTRLALPYLRAALLGLALCDEPQRMLVVGLGGGTLPRFLHHYYPHAVVDVVDIDSEVVRVARRHFGFRDDATLRVHVGDGRRYIEQVREPYDLVFLDAFDARNVPLHMTTREFLLAVRRAVRPGGAVVGNIWNSAHNPLYAPMVRTYREVFEGLRIVPVPQDVNHILLAVPRAIPDDRALAARASALAARRGFPYDPAAALAATLAGEEPAIRAAEVLRDASVGAF